MEEPRPAENTRRILIIDDTASIHRDFDKVLAPPKATESERALEALDELLFSEERALSNPSQTIDFEVKHAYQGQQGFEMVKEANAAGEPFAVAFVDMRMPPGWDGLKTIEEINSVDPNIQIVICSAYSDYSWAQIVDRLGKTDRLLILKKPFDQAEVFQLSAALSEKWLAERRTRNVLNELEAKVEQRTQELTETNSKLTELNGELKIAAEEARSSERSKSRFLATMSHEIRTTLNGIIGASNMLNMSKELNDSDRELTQIIQTSGDALMIVINDILDYSKYESGQLELEAVPFSLVKLVDECSSLLESTIHASNVDFSVKSDPKLPHSLVGDPARLRQILLNLLNNSFKFCKDGSVTCHIEVLSQNDLTASIRIAIEDTGIGMNEETKQRLFSAFMQADSSTTRKYGGTGLGLAICKLLADAMNANLSVESELEVGSTFSLTLELPISKSTPVNQPKSVANDESGSDDSPQIVDFGQRRILLVDDNAINRKLGLRFLKKLNVEANLAENGIEAVALFLEGDYELILMDLQMPEMDGFEATAKIRKYEAEHDLPRIPIVALTANAFTEIREQCLEAGMDDFLTKPMRMNELSKTLARHFASQNAES